MNVKIYKVRGEWVSEPFVTFGYAEMVMCEDYKALELEVEKLKSRVLELETNTVNGRSWFENRYGGG